MRTARSSRCPIPTSSRSSDARTSSGWNASGSSSSRTSRATRTCTTTSASPPAARPSGSTVRSRCDVKLTIGQAQSNHWGAGGGGKLICPGVVSDETIESNHCAFVPSPQTHYGAYAGPMRSDIDEVATMCSLDVTLNVLLDTRGRVLEAIRLAPAGAPARDRALQRHLHLRAPRRAGRHRDLRRLRAHRPPVLPHRLGLHVGRLRPRDGGTIIYASPSPGSRRRSATSPAWR